MFTAGSSTQSYFPAPRQSAAQQGKDSMINLLGALIRQSERRRTYNRIRHLDDRLLADIGLSRADLEMILTGRSPKGKANRP